MPAFSVVCNRCRRFWDSEKLHGSSGDRQVRKRTQVDLVPESPYSFFLVRPTEGAECKGAGCKAQYRDDIKFLQNFIELCALPSITVA